MTSPASSSPGDDGVNNDDKQPLLVAERFLHSLTSSEIIQALATDYSHQDATAAQSNDANCNAQSCNDAVLRKIVQAVQCGGDKKGFRVTIRNVPWPLSAQLDLAQLRLSSFRSGV